MYQPPDNASRSRPASSALAALVAFGGAIALLSWSRMPGDTGATHPGGAVSLIVEGMAFALLLGSALAIRSLGRGVTAWLARHAQVGAWPVGEAERRTVLIRAAVPPLLWLVVGVQALAVWSALAPGLMDGNATPLTRGTAAAVFALGMITLALGIADLIPIRAGRLRTDGYTLLHTLRNRP